MQAQHSDTVSSNKVRGAVPRTLIALVGLMLASPLLAFAASPSPTVAAVKAPSAGTPSPPPAPTVRSACTGSNADAVFERWSRPRPDGNGSFGVAVTPPANSVLPTVAATPGSKIVINTRLDADDVDADVMGRDSDRRTSVSVTRLDSQRWQIEMPSRRSVILGVEASYADGGDSRARITLRRPSRRAVARKLRGERVPVEGDTLSVHRKPNWTRVGSLERAQTFKVRRLSPSGKYAYGFAFGDIDKLGWVSTGGLEKVCR